MQWLCASRAAPVCAPAVFDAWVREFLLPHVQGGLASREALDRLPTARFLSFKLAQLLCEDVNAAPLVRVAPRVTRRAHDDPVSKGVQPAALAPAVISRAFFAPPKPIRP